MRISPYTVTLWEWAYGKGIDEKQLPAVLQLVDAQFSAFTAEDLPELILIRQRLKKTVAPMDKLIERLRGQPLLEEVAFCLEMYESALKISECALGSSTFLEEEQRFQEKILRSIFSKQRCLSASFFCNLYARRPQNVSWMDLLKTSRVLSLHSQLALDIEKKRFFKDLETHGVDVEKLQAFQASDSLMAKEIFDAYAAIHHLVGKEQIRAHFSSSAEKKVLSSSLFKKDLSLSVLSFAVLLGDSSVLHGLLEVGYRVNEASTGGYSAAHFAAMIPNLPMLLQLYRKGARFGDKTALGGTVYDLLKARGFAKINPQTPVVVGQDKKVPLREAKAHLGKDYLPDNIFTARALFDLYYKKIRDQEQNAKSYVDTVYEEIYRKAKAEGFRPPLFPYKIESGPLAGQWGLKAAGPISAGSYLGEYTGYVSLMEEGTKTPVNFKMGLGDSHIDGFAGSELLAFANHGPPNCYGKLIYHAGTPRYAFFAARNFKPGDIFYINYEWIYFTETPFFELNPEAIDSFVEQMQGLSNIFPIGTMLQGSTWTYLCLRATNNYERLFPEQFSGTRQALFEKDVAVSYTQGMVGYIINFPDRLITLIQSGKISPNPVLALLKTAKSKDHLGFLNLTPERIDALIQRISQ